MNEPIVPHHHNLPEMSTSALLNNFGSFMMNTGSATTNTNVGGVFDATPAASSMATHQNLQAPLQMPMTSSMMQNLNQQQQGQPSTPPAHLPPLNVNYWSQ